MDLPPAILVERILSGEVEALSGLAAEIWRECYAELVTVAQIEYMLEWMYAPDHLRDEIEKQGIEYFWVKEPGSSSDQAPPPCGFLAFGPGESDDEIFLHKLYVHSDQRGKGIGAAAMAWLTEQRDQSVGRRFSKIRLRVNRGNHPAIRAYLRAGFQMVDNLCSDIGEGFVMDDFVMLKVMG